MVVEKQTFNCQISPVERFKPDRLKKLIWYIKYNNFSYHFKFLTGKTTSFDYFETLRIDLAVETIK